MSPLNCLPGLAVALLTPELLNVTVLGVGERVLLQVLFDNEWLLVLYIF